MICEIDYPMDKSSWKGLGGSIGRERADIGEVLSLGIIVFPVQRYEKERRIQEKAPMQKLCKRLHENFCIGVKSYRILIIRVNL